MNDSRMCASVGDKAPRPFIIEAIFMSILLNQQKELTEMEKKLKQLENSISRIEDARERSREPQTVNKLSP